MITAPLPTDVAFVLSGGGAKGSFQVGAMQALFSRGVVPSAIYGTSVGALNAVAYVYAGINAMGDQWLSIKGRGDVLSARWYNPFTSGIYSMSPLRKILNKQILSKKKIAQIMVCVTYTDFEDLSLHYAYSSDICSSDFVDAVLASSCIPTAMVPVFNKNLGKGALFDGGVREQVPISQAIKDGYKKVYVISCNPVVENPSESTRWKKSWPYFLSYGLRGLDGLEHEVFLGDNREGSDMDMDDPTVSVRVIANPSHLIGTLEFSPEKIRTMIARGKEQAMNVELL